MIYRNDFDFDKQPVTNNQQFTEGQRLNEEENFGNEEMFVTEERVNGRAAEVIREENRRTRIKYKSKTVYNAEDYWERFRQLVDDNEMTQREACLDIGLPPPTIITLKRARNFPRAEIAYDFAKLLNTTVEYMVTGNAEFNTDPELEQLIIEIAKMPNQQKKVIKNIIRAQIKYWASVDFNTF